MKINIPVSPGELIDKITILRIKAARVRDAGARARVQHELALLEAVRAARIPTHEVVERAAAELEAVNEALWVIEDDIREHERRGSFGSAFVELARSVYKTNDRRSALKRQIDEALGSELSEVKSYQAY